MLPGVYHKFFSFSAQLVNGGAERIRFGVASFTGTLTTPRFPILIKAED
jgi:hypothetical protein